MDAKEIRTFTDDELRVRVRQWRDELFRSKFKAESSESRDTSIFRKLKQDIARGETILSERRQGGVVAAPKAEAGAEDKATPAPKKARKAAGKAAQAEGEGNQ